MILIDQIISFLVSFVYGFFLYWIICKIYSYLFYKNRYMRILFNAIFCIGSAFIYFFILLLLNNGIIHSYFLLFLIFGFLISYCLLKKK